MVCTRPAEGGQVGQPRRQLQQFVDGQAHQRAAVGVRWRHLGGCSASCPDGVLVQLPGLLRRCRGVVLGCLLLAQTSSTLRRSKNAANARKASGPDRRP
jgi:hypothetical protein